MFGHMLLHDEALMQAVHSGSIGIDPFDPALVQPSSIDMRLGHEFAIIDTSNRRDMDVREDNSERAHRITVPPEDYFLLRPEHFVLATTAERIRMSVRYAGRVEGKSSLGRLGLMVHSTAGFIDPGFEGAITLELSNMLDVPIRLYPGMPVAQLAVFLMAGQARSYAVKGKYAGQTGPTTSQYHRNFMAATDDETNVQ